MKCFYCGRAGRSGSEEHIPSAFLGSRLKTRRVCGDCNQLAGDQIDDPFSKQLLVLIPRALNDVRNIRKQSKEPFAETSAIVSASGESISVRFSPSGREASNEHGELVHETLEVTYSMDRGLWTRFAAKTALGCASLVQDEDWIDTPLADGLRELLWGGRIDPSIWPNGVPAWPEELPPDDVVRSALGERKHAIGLLNSDQETGSAVASIFLFGGTLYQRLPLPGFAVSGSGPTWVIDPAPSAPPHSEDFDDAIARLLKEQGWTHQQIEDARVQ